MDKENLEVVLPDVKKRSGFLVYLKVIFLPFILFAIVFCGYLGYIDLKLSIVELSLITCIFLMLNTTQNTLLVSLSSKKMNLSRLLKDTL